VGFLPRYGAEGPSDLEAYGTRRREERIILPAHKAKPLIEAQPRPQQIGGEANIIRVRGPQPLAFLPFEFCIIRDPERARLWILKYLPPHQHRHMPILRSHEFVEPVRIGGLVIIEHGDPVSSDAHGLIKRRIASRGDSAPGLVGIVDRERAVLREAADASAVVRLGLVIDDDDRDDQIGIDLLPGEGVSDRRAA
jgi:hypothetical protein